MAGDSAMEISSSPPRRESSNLLMSPPRRSSGKERRNPSITPRKFKRFFTPRTQLSSPQLHPDQISISRQALQDLHRRELNRYQTPAPSSPLKPSEDEEAVQDENYDTHNTTIKRRKLQHTPESSPCLPQRFSLNPAGTISQDISTALLSPIRSSQSSQDISDVDETMHDALPKKRTVPLTSRGLSGQLFQRQLGGMPKAGSSRMSFPVSDWRTETADFYSRPEDAHYYFSHDGTDRSIPFCTATCHTNSLVAIGDEEGRVRLLESSGEKSQPFKRVHLSFQAHSNAIIDLAFSSDDLRLATASGDQTGRVIDMMTQTPIAMLHEHTASLKQVRFQPGKSNGFVLATSSRDGSVHIWDLRCKGPVQEIPALPERETGLTYRMPAPKSGCAVNSLYDTHARNFRQTRQLSAGVTGDLPSRGELPGRIGDVSVTALQFLPEGQEHLLLTACEADASVKLWDIRSSASRHKINPVSMTTPPISHLNWRPFGITSLSLNTDSSRLYTLCKDNTVYAYSVPHLILGQAQDIAAREAPRRRLGNTTHQGLGPMYGFRHQIFHATSFYVKCAVRPARDGCSELLAVGSSDGGAVIFPTAERYFRDDLSGAMSNMSLENSTIATSASFPSPRLPVARGSSLGMKRPAFQVHRTNSFSQLNKDTIPIVRTGTPLVRGHDREVGALAWTDRGKLVTVGDDYLIRCWHEDREKSKDLRVGGETSGRRWGCGWADVGEDWDGDCEDDEY